MPTAQDVYATLYDTYHTVCHAVMFMVMQPTQYTNPDRLRAQPLQLSGHTNTHHACTVYRVHSAHALLVVVHTAVNSHQAASVDATTLNIKDQQIMPATPATVLGSRPQCHRA